MASYLGDGRDLQMQVAMIQKLYQLRPFPNVPSGRLCLYTRQQQAGELPPRAKIFSVLSIRLRQERQRLCIRLVVALVVRQQQHRQ